jgi:hypothetical protein
MSCSKKRGFIKQSAWASCEAARSPQGNGIYLRASAIARTLGGRPCDDRIHGHHLWLE